MENKSEIALRLKDISKVFDINKVLNLKTDSVYVQKYYRINKIPYSLFHSKSDLIHMGVSRNGKYTEDDLLEPARTVEGYIKKLKANNVLELATGRGANSYYLAQRFPNINFYGIDISKGQLDYAFKKAKIATNFYPDFCDYHDLKKFENGTFDIVFIIEALCYSENKEKVLAEVYRVLRKGGIFVIYDGYSRKKAEQLSNSEKIAVNLAEKGMALENIESYAVFINKVNSYKFTIVSEEDISQFTLPTMERFEKISTFFFRFPRLVKPFTLFFPNEFLYNIISGYLLPPIVRSGIGSYMITILKK